MRIWVDCEFNEFRGDLISMGLVTEDGRQWYEVLSCVCPGDWVRQHVMPLLGKAPISRGEFSRRLGLWLMQFNSVHVIADWPEDIAHFCESLIVGPGQRLNTPALTMEIRRDLDVIESKVPHHALHDAIAIRDSHLTLDGCALPGAEKP